MLLNNKNVRKTVEHGKSKKALRKEIPSNFQTNARIDNKRKTKAHQYLTSKKKLHVSS